MKRTDVSPKNPKTPKNPRYWMSLEQWSQDPEFQKMAENEFMSSPLSVEDEGGSARRSFLKLMGASLALGSFGCMRRPAQKIVPYVNRPKDVTPGVANYYASSVIDGFEGFGVIVTTREGRPIKIEGNPDHPMNRGGLSARAHAHLLSLYDPERISGAKQNLFNEARSNYDTIRVSWEKADKTIQKQLTLGSVALLTGEVASPSMKKLIKDFQVAHGVDHYTWEPTTFDDHLEANEKCYGQAVVSRPRLDKADYIVAIDADFLGTYLSPTEMTRDFSRGRKKLERGMNRLVVFESLMSLTGSNADERFQIKPSQQFNVVMGLAHDVAIKLSGSASRGPVSRLNSSWKKFLNTHRGASQRLGLDLKKWNLVVEELVRHQGRSLVMAGGLRTSQGIQLQVAVNFLNAILGNEGKTIESRGAYTNIQSRASHLMALVEKINRGEVKTLIIHGTNPVYGAPDNQGFTEALKKVEMVIYTGDRVDETGAKSHYVLPDHHFMENWGDVELAKGLYSIQQPTIRPMNDTRAFQESLLKWMGREKSSWYDFLRMYWKENIFRSWSTLAWEKSWMELLQKGVWESSYRKVEAQKVSAAPHFRMYAALATLEEIAEASPSTQGSLELALYFNSGLRDGSMANVSWLQEFPDPVTKICWDNYVTLSMKAAQEKGLSEGDVVELKNAQGLSIEVPVHIQPGQHESVVGLAMGYGRWKAGKVADGVGMRAYGLINYEKGVAVLAGSMIGIRKVGRRALLAGTQGHHSMEGRQIVVEATLDQYKSNPSANIHRHKVFSIWNKHEYKSYKWAMSVDLNSCTGCGACMVACQSENNIPTVGKRHLLNGREMHWIRVDRYYVGDPKDPDVVHMPVMCQHCDNAPCETVCPVAATVHSHEGTNDMIYNRCVGTRYCANNCPYKVRRFNWFKYDDIQSPLNLALNPEVTVRSRGVMEKCTFCNHRIKEAKNKARLDGGRKVKDGEIKTACEQSCPAEAIVFGDMNDKNSRVSQEHAKENSYSLLEELNNVPAVRYLSKVRHSDHLKSGHSLDHGQEKGGHH